MFDTRLRRVVGPHLTLAGQGLASRGVTPGVVTVVAWLAGAGACVAVTLRLWPAALALWLLNRLLDGLDGPVARAIGQTDRGAYLDVVSDFSVYGGFVLGLAIAVPNARVSCVVLLFTYYVSGTALLTLSSLLERRRQNDRDERSVRLTGGLAEGFETVVVYALFCLLPNATAVIAWTFSTAVAITAIQRIWTGAQLLR